MTALSRRTFMQSTLSVAVAGLADRLHQGTDLMRSDQSIRVGVMGLGRRGLEHLQIYAAIPCVQVVALYDSLPGRLAPALRSLQDVQRRTPRHARGVEDLLDDPRLDAVSIAGSSANSLRNLPAWIKRAGQAGKTLLLDLPVTSENWKSSAAMLKAVRQSQGSVHTYAGGYAALFAPPVLSPECLALQCGSGYHIAVRSNAFHGDTASGTVAATAALETALRAVGSSPPLTASGIDLIKFSFGGLAYLPTGGTPLETHALGGPVDGSAAIDIDGLRGRARFHVPARSAEDTAAASLLSFVHSVRRASAQGNLAAHNSLLAQALLSRIRFGFSLEGSAEPD